MKLRLPSLREGLNPIDETVDPGELDLDTDVFRVPVHITGEVDVSETQLDVRMHIETEGNYTCDRCAIEFERPFEVDDRVLVLRRHAADSEEEEAEGLMFIGPDATEADLSGEIVDAILLDVPIKTLHSPDCKGLCPVCYADWNEETCEHYEQYHTQENDGDRDGK
jgi:uncharacterized protein